MLSIEALLTILVLMDAATMICAVLLLVMLKRHFAPYGVGAFADLSDEDLMPTEEDIVMAKAHYETQVSQQRGRVERLGLQHKEEVEKGDYVNEIRLSRGFKSGSID